MHSAFLVALSSVIVVEKSRRSVPCTESGPDKTCCSAGTTGVTFPANECRPSGEMTPSRDSTKVLGCRGSRGSF